MFLRSEPRLRISGGFWLLMAWFALTNGWRPLALILAAALTHELAHCLALRLFGVRAGELRITVLGAEITADCRSLPYSRELVAILAGPAANLLCGLILAVAGRWFPRGDWWYAFAGAHLILGGLNLLPLRALDGGRALFLLLQWRMGPGTAERWGSVIAAITGAALAALLFAAIWYSGGSLWLAPVALAALATSIQEVTCAVSAGKMR